MYSFFFFFFFFHICNEIKNHFVTGSYQLAITITSVMNFSSDSLFLKKIQRFRSLILCKQHHIVSFLERVGVEITQKQD